MMNAAIDKLRALVAKRGTGTRAPYEAGDRLASASDAERERAAYAAVSVLADGHRTLPGGRYPDAEWLLAWAAQPADVRTAVLAEWDVLYGARAPSRPEMTDAERAEFASGVNADNTLGRAGDCLNLAKRYPDDVTAQDYSHDGDATSCWRYGSRTPAGAVALAAVRAGARPVTAMEQAQS